MIRYDTIRYDTIQYDKILYDTIRYDTIRFDTIQKNTMQQPHSVQTIAPLSCLSYQSILYYLELDHNVCNCIYVLTRFYFLKSKEMNIPKSRTVNLDAPQNYIPLYLRGGTIIPTQKPANNTMFRYGNFVIYSHIWYIVEIFSMKMCFVPQIKFICSNKSQHCSIN